MKLAIFGPVHEESAIARVTVLVKAALELAGHNVALVRTDLDPEGESAAVAGGLENAVSWRDQTAIQQIVDESDIILHQLGDHYPYHAGNAFWLRKIGGVVALHDLFLGSLFVAWMAEHPDEAAEILHTWYGIDLDTYLVYVRSGHFFLDRTWPRYPMVEWLCQYADGVIVHSDFGLAMVKRATDAPVIVAPLPYRPTGDAAAPRRRTDQHPHDSRSLRILTFGRINRNKLVELVIAAIGGDRSLRGSVEYRVVGSILGEVRERVVELARDLGVRLHVTGTVSPEELAEEIEAADVVLGLRRPAVESASASTIEALLAGKPVVVLDHGFYQGLPADVVIHLDPRDTLTSVTEALLGISRGECDLVAMGERAREYAAKTFRADAYAARLLEIGREAAHEKPLREIQVAFGCPDTPIPVRESFEAIRSIFLP